jgi:hypothetical protein
MARIGGRSIVCSSTRRHPATRERSNTMNGPDASLIPTSSLRQACLVEGCPCKDARILSPRRAAYFASVAAARGQTANREIVADDGWRLPTSPALEATWALAALEIGA